MECLADEEAVLIRLEGMANGGLHLVGVEQTEAVFSDFVIVGVGYPAFETVVIEGDAGDEDLDF